MNKVSLLIIFIIISAFASKSERNDITINEIEQHWLKPMPGCIHMSYVHKLPGEESIREYTSLDSFDSSMKEIILLQLNSVVGSYWAENLNFKSANIYRIQAPDGSYDTLSSIKYWFTYRVEDTNYYTQAFSDISGENFILSNAYLQSGITAPLLSLSKAWQSVRENKNIPRSLRIHHESGLKNFDNQFFWVLLSYKGASYFVGKTYRIIINAITGEFLGVFNNREYRDFYRKMNPVRLNENRK